MSKKNEVRQMTSRYCPKLDDNVIVMTSSDENGFEKRTCLSSHLCHSDDSAACFITAAAPAGRRARSSFICSKSIYAAYAAELR